jgi:hypothetical protein
VRKLMAVGSIWWIFTLVVPVYAQQIDLAFGGGPLIAPNTNNTFSGLNNTLNGGTYLGVGGDYLLKRKFGVGAEVFWRKTQGLYNSGYPYRPFFWNFNAIYAPKFNKHFGAEIVAGLGAETIREYGLVSNCDAYGNCSNYASDTHFMGDVGGGFKIYPFRGIFVRPEVRLYLVPNNVEFNSSFAVRYGASIGFTLGGGGSK